MNAMKQYFLINFYKNKLVSDGQFVGGCDELSRVGAASARFAEEEERLSRLNNGAAGFAFVTSWSRSLSFLR